MLRNALWEGMVAGAAGAAVMTVGEKIEQAITGRPNSHVPARVLARLTGASEAAGKHSTALNWTMHFGQGVALGVLRSVMAEVGLRGPLASAKFTVVRLTNDQILENATGVGAPPQTWPRSELVIDVLHKGVYGFVTGAVADALAARRGPGPGGLHAELVPGRHADVGPLPRSMAAGRKAHRGT
ncbi:hypothetical protein [Rhodococcus sp. NPDC047139]|uniref:hypothetical protein n=1 Tax=Rhodococcus sp. NPDC047139 TaxID=3155141 RepID=UPI0033DFBA01